MNDTVAPDLDFEREKWKEQCELDREKWKTQYEFEREKWQAECVNQKRDSDLKDRELKLRKEEIDLKKRESRLALWINPLAIAIVGATIAGVLNVWVNAQNNQATLKLESRKAEATRIVEMIKPGWRKGSQNLRFLAESGLISDPILAGKIKQFVADNKSGPGPSLSSSLTPPTQYFSTSEPNVFVACDYNPVDQTYNLNCRRVTL